VPLAEPLTYSTQSRPQVPSYDGPSFRNRAVTETGSPEQQQFRVRDFSPEGRRAAPSAPSSWSQVASPNSSDLDYHTEARPAAEAPPAQAAPAPIAELPPSIAPAQPYPAYASQLPVEHTLTRRELRAMQQAEEAALNSQVPELVQPQAPAPAAPPLVDSSPFEALFRSQAPASEPTPASTFTTGGSVFDVISAESQQPVQQQPVQPREPGTWTPPRGHWSTQVDAEDDFPENTINRRINSGSTATNALVLPSIPLGDIRGPLTGTGEIMLTGSIDLPSILSSTGQTDRFDSRGIDDLFDLSDAEVTSTDSSPVRAIRAVSTHTSGHSVTHTQKPKGTKALTALLIAASSMAVVVAGLLVAAFAFNVF
jgi:hypothetical protein